MITVDGHMIKENIKRALMIRDTTASLFDGSLHKFADEDKESPQTVMTRYRKADLALAKLQTIQTMYNLAVRVDVLGEKMTLCEAIKQVGGAGREEKMWRSAAGVKKDRYSYHDAGRTRNKDEVRAKEMITNTQALELAMTSAKRAAALRAAIAKGNSMEISMDVTLPDF